MDKRRNQTLSAAILTAIIHSLLGQTRPCYSFLTVAVVSRYPCPQQQQQQQQQHPRHSLNVVPDVNPFFDDSATSLAGISYAAVLNEVVLPLFPAQQLDSRNALSRTEGYWPYVQRNQKPPLHLTYGEFDFYFFAQLLDKSRKYFHDYHKTSLRVDADEKSWANLTFCDMGSGTGRLVLAAAALHPWRLCRGIEVLPKLHQASLRNLQTCQANSLSRCDFMSGSFDDPYIYFGDSDCIFVFSSCMPVDVLSSLAESIGRQCKTGTVVITIDYKLPKNGKCRPFDGDDRVLSGQYEFELMEQIQGWCWLTGGGDSTAYVHRLKTSLNQGPLTPVELSLQQKALRVVKDLEAGKLTDPNKFLRDVHNSMIFQGFPERFLPKLN